MRRLVLWLAVCLLPVRVMEAQADSARRDTVRSRLSPIVVQGARQSATVGGASAVVAPIDSLLLPPGAPLEAVLRKVPFVLVRQNSRGEVELSVRGSDSRQAAILYDGIPITLGWDSRADPSLFPLAGAENIVLVRGLATLLQGPNTLGGVVELGVVSHRSDDASAPRVAIRLGVDQVGGQGYQVDAVRPVMLGGGTLTVRAGAGFRDRPAVALSGDVIDPFTRDDRRANSDVTQRDGYVALRYATAGGGWIGSSVSGYSAERGVMPELHLQAPRFWRYPEQTRHLALIAAGTGRRHTPWGAGDMELALGVNGGHTSIENFAGARYDSVTARELGDERTTTLRLFGDHSLGRGELRTSFTLAQVGYDETLDRAAPNVYVQRLWSGALEADQPLTGAWRVTGGLGWDAAETPKTGGKPPLGTLREWGARVGLTTLAFDNQWRLHASASRRARFPALRELYSGALNRFEPNPDLRPEVLRGVEVGATRLAAGLELQGVVFVQRLDDVVVRITQPDRRFKRVNRDHQRAVGLELMGGGSIGPARLVADAMLQHVRIVDRTAAGAERRPENQPSYRAGLDATLPVGGFIGRAALQHNGPQYCVHPERRVTDRLASQTMLGGGVERGWRRHAGLLGEVRLSLQVDNIVDAAVFDQCGLPAPGRTWRLGLTLR